MEKFIYAIYAFLVIVGGYSIISSLIDLSDRKSEEHSDVETRWFKWKGPVRLVFGLVCLISVIAIYKINFCAEYETITDDAEHRIIELTNENHYLRDQIGYVSGESPYYLLKIKHESSASILLGKVLFSNDRQEIKVRGAYLLDLNKNYIASNSFEAKFGDKYLLFFKNEIFGINVIEASPTELLEPVIFEVYKE